MITHIQLKHYAHLMRLHKPIGILLLLWPTCWALWLAAAGRPTPKNLFIFAAGVVLMRSAGCIINDFADRKWDGAIARTRDRPLVSGMVAPVEALGLAVVLGFVALCLVWQCNQLTLRLAFIGAGLAVFYPFLKRWTHLPQVGLGFAFAWGVPMAFAAETGSVHAAAWFLFLTAAVWPVIYDTMYAMADRAEDIPAGIKSTAILFAAYDRGIIAFLQGFFLVLLIIVGMLFHLHAFFYISLLLAGVFFVYQQWLIKNREPQQCLAAFLNNHWVGLIIFLGIYLSTP